MALLCHHEPVDEMNSSGRNTRPKNAQVNGHALPSATQPETRKLQQVCCRLAALLSSSRYQDAFASLAPA